MTTLSRQKTAHALRHFNICGSLWAIYGPNATAAGAIFAGLALNMGLSEAQIAFLVSLSSLAGAWQLFSFYVTRGVRHPARFMMVFGTLEITFASAVVLVYYLAPGWRFPVTAVLLIGAYILGNTNSPLFANWFSNVLPEDTRASFLGRRWFIITSVSMVYLYAASRWLDFMGKTHEAFMTIFFVGWVTGILGYAILMITPHPDLAEAERHGFARSLLAPFRNRAFVRLAVYQFARTTAYMVAGAFYGVYMIKYLELSYSQIAIYTNITLFMMVVGYLAVGNLAQRYGSKPILQILIVPALAVPALFALTTPDNYRVLLTVASFINGLCIAGLDISVSTLLYKTLPGGEENSVYFASWNSCISAAAALGPVIGGLLKTYLPATMVLGGMQFTNLRVIFVLAAAASLVPLVLAAFLQEGKAISPMYVLGQFRGNLLSLAYNYGLFTVARSHELRAEALLRLGRTRSPLAVDRLLRGLDDVSHEVRAKAARALGEGRFEEGVEPLTRELQDKESDIRSEAAEALGKIGAAPALLLEALEDDDTRVRVSAAMALSELHTPEAQEALLQALRGEFDRNLFPTLVDAASRDGDVRLLLPALEGLTRLHAPIVRLQVINGICRVLGEKNHYYRLATADELTQGHMREKMMERIRRLLEHPRYGDGEQQGRLAALGSQLEVALDNDDLDAFAELCLGVAEIARQLELDRPIPHHAAVAILHYLAHIADDTPPDEVIVFLVTCLTALARGLAEPTPARA
jgi:hypothetical protein